MRHHTSRRHKPAGRLTGGLAGGLAARFALGSLLLATPLSASPSPTPLPHAPRTLATQDADLQAVRELIDQGDLTQAQRQLDRALEAERSADALSARARVHFLHSEIAHAGRLANEAIEIDPRCQEALATRAMVLATLNKTDEALACADQALSLGVDDGWAMNAGARALIAARRYDDALDQYSRILDANPRDLVALNGIAAVLLAQGDAEGAQASLTQAVELAAQPGSALWARAHVREGLGEIDGALADFAAAVEASPDDLRYRYDYAALLFQLRRFDAMNDVIDVALQIDPDLADFLCLRGQALELDEDFRGALREYNLAADADPDDAYPHLRMAYVYRDHLRDYGRCIEAWDRAIERSAEPADYYFRRGFAHRTFGQNQKAFDDFATAVDLDDTHIKAWSSIAEMVEPREALPILVRLCELDPENGDWPGHIGYLYAMAGDREEEIKWHTRCLELDPGNHDARRNRGLAYAQVGMAEEAAADHTYQIEHCDNRNYVVRAYFDRGNANLGLEDFAAAEDDFRQTIRMGNTMPAAAYNLGLSYQYRSMWEEAIAAYSTAIRQFPEYASALGNRALCHDSMGQYEQGLADIDAANALAPRTADWHHELRARFLLKLGRYEEVLPETDQALRRNRENPRAWQERLTALLHLGQDVEAARAAEIRSQIGQPGLACYAVAQCYAAAGRLDESADWLALSLERDIPTPDWSHHVATIVHLARGDFDAAEESGKQFLALAPDEPDAYLYLALIERFKGNEAESQRLAQRGAWLPDNEEDASGLAVLRVITGQSGLDEQIEPFDENRRIVLELYVGYWLYLGSDTEAGLALIAAAAQCPDPARVPWEAAAAKALDARLNPDQD